MEAILKKYASKGKKRKKNSSAVKDLDNVIDSTESIHSISDAPIKLKLAEIPAAKKSLPIQDGSGWISLPKNDIQNDIENGSENGSEKDIEKESENVQKRLKIDKKEKIRHDSDGSEGFESDLAEISGEESESDVGSSDDESELELGGE